MRQTKDIDDAVNDIVMVVVHQQKKRTILYSIHSTYFYLCLLRRVQAGYVMFLGDATSLYDLLSEAAATVPGTYQVIAATKVGPRPYKVREVPDSS